MLSPKDTHTGGRLSRKQREKKLQKQKMVFGITFAKRKKEKVKIINPQSQETKIAQAKKHGKKLNPQMKKKILNRT